MSVRVRKDGKIEYDFTDKEPASGMAGQIEANSIARANGWDGATWIEGAWHPYSGGGGSPATETMYCPFDRHDPAWEDCEEEALLESQDMDVYGSLG